MKRQLIFLGILLLGLCPATALAAPPRQGEAGQEYVVQADDWLSKIAEKFYGDPLAFPAIVAATNARAASDQSYMTITDPNLIEIGQKLYIPTAEAAAALAGPSSTPATFPVTLTNCGLEISVAAPPQRAVAMNQSAVEIMLALGLQDQMVGTAYLDDAILPEFSAAYAQIPALAEEYPSQEVLFAAEPDFVYGGFGSAFAEEAAGPRPELIELGITPYVSPAHCDDTSLRPEKAAMETVYGEIRDIGRIFGVPERAEALIAGMEADLAEVQAGVAGVEKPLRVLWFDSGVDEALIGAGSGVPHLIMELAGAENVFADIPGAWETISWEEIVARDADAIVLIDAGWSTAAEKKALLTGAPAYASLTAIKQDRFITIPFSHAAAGIRNAAAVRLVAEGLYPERFQ